MSLSFSRRAAVSLVLPAFLALGVTVASGQTFPTKPLRIVVPATTGGGPDTIARLVQPHLQQTLGQPVVIENKPGAATNIGTESAARSAPDGHTLLISTTSIATSGALYANPGYDAIEDFSSVMLLTTQPYLLVVHPSVPAENLRELVDLAKSKTRKLTYASTGSGQGAHLAMELLKSSAGIDVIHVPYKGASAAMPDLVAGRVDMFFTTPATARVHLQSGKLRAIAVSGSKRSKSVPDVPTIAEQGLSDYRVDGWYGLHVPKGTPLEAINVLHKAFSEALRQPDVVNGLNNIGVNIEASTPQELDVFLRREVETWSALILKLGIKVD